MRLVPFRVGNMIARALVEMTKLKSFMAGLPMTTLYAKGQLMIKKSAIIVT